jgi:Laminin G domain/EGF-like domain
MVEIQLDSWYRIHVERSNQQAQMTINDEENIFGTSPGTLTGLNLNTSLYVGGVSNLVKVASGVQVQTGFNGCISKVTKMMPHSYCQKTHLFCFQIEINGASYNLTDSGSVLDSANVADCGEAAACASQPCKNRGICAEEGPSQYYCTCADGFTGLIGKTNLHLID